jgi:hypothetical protein
LNNLKDVILQTLEDLEDKENININIEENKQSNIDKQYLKKLREKILVLFEGLQSPNTTNLEKKLDLTINFLEYLLSDIDEKLSK